MKTTVLIGVMAAVLGAGWIVGCNNDVEFTRIVVGKTWGLQHRDDSSWYEERVLVKNIPRNEKEQSKIMIAYFDSVGLSIDDLSRMPEIDFYTMFFYKSTSFTRRFFIKGETKIKYNANKTYLGCLSIMRCENNSAKWKVDISRNLGTEPDADYVGCKTKKAYLQNDCDPAWYEANKDRDLVKHYMELRNK